MTDRINIRDLEACPKCNANLESLHLNYDAVLECIQVECLECSYKFQADCADK